MPRFLFGVPNGPEAQENWEGFPFADFLVCYEDFWACCSHFSACCWEKLRSNRSTSAQSAAGCSANFYVTYSYLFSDSWMWDYKYSDHNYWQINTMTNNIKHHQTTFCKKGRSRFWGIFNLNLHDSTLSPSMQGWWDRWYQRLGSFGPGSGCGCGESHWEKRTWDHDSGCAKGAHGHLSSHLGKPRKCYM